MEENSENKETEEKNIEEKPEDAKEIADNSEEKVDETEDSLVNNSNPSGEPASEQSEEASEEKDPEEKPAEIIPKEKKAKEGSWAPMVIVMGLSFVILFIWDKVPALKNAVHAVLDPSAGALLNWDLTFGMLIIVLIINLAVTLIQKYATDQKALRELKKEQKILQEEMKKYREHPEKMAELSKKQFAFLPKTMKLTSRAIMFTGVPFILFFRWFDDVFTAMETATGEPVRFFGFLSWFLFYLIFTMVFSGFLRKWLKVV